MKQLKTIIEKMIKYIIQLPSTYILIIVSILTMDLYYLVIHIF